MMNPPDRHEHLVRLGVKTYLDTFKRAFAMQVADGRLPGMPKPTREDALGFFDESPIEYWVQLALQAPEEALRQIRSFGEGVDRGLV